jgi:hypothetical protein
LFVSFYYYDLLDKESKLKQNTLELEKNNLNNKLLELQLKNDEAEHLISIFRDTSNIVVPLQGQDAAPKAFAKIYWNKKNKTIYIDALGLPSPPFGMVYQVWAFKLNPLTPTNLGVTPARDVRPPTDFCCFVVVRVTTAPASPARAVRPERCR